MSTKISALLVGALLLAGCGDTAANRSYIISEEKVVSEPASDHIR